MNKNKKELLKNTIIIFLGKFCTQFLSFFFLPLYTAVLTSREYGIVDLIITYISLIVPLISLQLEMAIFRELIDFRDDNDKISTIISTGFICIVIQFVICLLFYSVIGLFVRLPYSKYIILNTFATLLSNLVMQISRGLGKNVSYSISSVIAGVGNIIFNLLFIIVFNMRVEGMLLASIISNLFAFVYLLITCDLFSKIKFSFYKSIERKKLLKYSLPLVPNGLIWWIINVSDRTIISLFISTAANGIYAVSNKFSNLLIQIFGVFNMSWTESASLHIHDKNKDDFFSDIFNYVVTLFSFVCILIINIMPFVFGILVDNKFSEAYNYIPLLLIGMLFNIIVTFVGSIYVSLKKTSEVAKTSFWAGFLNIFFNLLLVRKIGIYAAAISTILSFLIMSITRLVDVQKYVRLKIDFLSFFSLMIVMSLSCYCYYKRLLIFNIILGLITIIMFLIKNKKYFGAWITAKKVRVN